jgi:hypothetical protein
MKYEMMANKFNEICIDDAGPEKAGVGGSIPSLATISFQLLRAEFKKSLTPTHP